MATPTRAKADATSRVTMTPSGTPTTTPRCESCSNDASVREGEEKVERNEGGYRKYMRVKSNKGEDSWNFTFSCIFWQGRGVARNGKR